MNQLQKHLNLFFFFLFCSLAIQSLDSLNEQIVQVFLSSQSDGHLNEDPVTAARWSHQCRHSMVLMRRLLIEAQAKFRKMMSDNKALASRIDKDIQSAHLQVSALRAELADTNQRIKDICLQSESSAGMAGNVITTCMPPTSTTNTAVSSTADGHWSKEAKEEQSVTRGESSSADMSRTLPSSPPIADKGGTKTAEISAMTDQPRFQSFKPVQSSKVDVPKPFVANGPPKENEATSTDKSLTVPNSSGSKIINKDKTLSPTKSATEETKDEQNKAHTSPQTKQEQKEKPDSLTESSEASEETSFSRHRSHRRERRSLKGSDVQKSLLNELISQQGSDTLDDSKSELQRSESESNQNSAPECDLSLSGSPFKEDNSKIALEKSVLDSNSSKNVQGIKENHSDKPKREEFNIDLHRNSPPVKDDSNAQCFNFLKESTTCSKDLSEGHRYKAKTKSDPLDKRRDKCAQEYAVLSSPSSVMRHKPGASKLQLGICSWEDRRFDRSDTSSNSAWYKTQNSSSTSGKSLLGESSSKDETSDSQDAEFCDRGSAKDDCQGRYVVFDSRRPQNRQWRQSLSESYRDQVITDTWKNTGDTNDKNTALLDDKREVPEKDDQSTKPHAQESSYFRKSLNLDYSYNGK